MSEIFSLENLTLKLYKIIPLAKSLTVEMSHKKTYTKTVKAKLITQQILTAKIRRLKIGKNSEAEGLSLEVSTEKIILKVLTTKKG